MHTRSYPIQLPTGPGMYLSNLQQHESYSTIYASQQPNSINPLNSQSTFLCYAFFKIHQKSVLVNLFLHTTIFRYLTVV